MSTQTSEKIHNRSARYVLQVKDKKVMRYAPYARGHRAFFTEILNLSESGMAFTVPFLDSPQLHETIMVEFTVPGGSSVACFAKVKRIQDYRLIEADFFQKNCKLVAVKFEKMHDEQIRHLRENLNKEFRAKQNQFLREQRWLKLQWYWRFHKPFLLASLAMTFSLFALFIWWLS